MTDAEKTFRVGQLVITERTTYGVLEKSFTEKFRDDKTITMEDNVLIDKNSIGLVVGHITNWVVPATIVTFSNIRNGQYIVLTYNKIVSLNDFISQLDS